MAPFYGWFSTVKATGPQLGDSLLFTTQSQGVPGTRLIDLRKRKDWVHIGATQWFWTSDPSIGNPVPEPLGQLGRHILNEKGQFL